MELVMKKYKVVPEYLFEWIGEADANLSKIDLSDCELSNGNM